MVHQEPAEEMAERLSLHALGLLDGDEAAAMEAHAAQCAVCAEELRTLRQSAAAVSLTAEPFHPGPGVRERVLAIPSPQVWRNWTPAPGDLHVVREAEGEWQKVREGVWAKQLYVDRTRDMATMMVRMEPGSRYIPHRHAAPEQCFVLSGDIRDGVNVYHAGDFQCLAKGSVHGDQWTEGGCTLLIVSSLEDELLV